MKLRPIDILFYSLTGTAGGAIAAFLIGSAMSLTLPPEQRERFESGFWKRTVPWITLTCGIVSGASHASVMLIKRSLIQSEAESPAPVQNVPPVALAANFPEDVLSPSVPSEQQVRTQLESLFSAPEPRYEPETEPNRTTIPHPLDL
jgi:hypothetical protein